MYNIEQLLINTINTCKMKVFITCYKFDWQILCQTLLAAGKIYL